MRKIADYAEVVLREQYEVYTSKKGHSPKTIEEWAVDEAHNDPTFYEWLFNDDSIAGFGDLSDEEMKMAFNFFKSL